MEVKEMQGQPGDALDIRRLALNSGTRRNSLQPYTHNEEFIKKVIFA
jgi:hypothetical protein